ncbi:hypothetical protein [Sphingomonas abietis]|uniref:Autotransporter outer membrane beta-barrel domain-containing protein n=1 Tax=Sphingomonas abietis TaxID=3012344 RepID=A0ABY7NSS0_9SPHN|nr:hypothetical protein [Sphingomonas abietis]WBO22521.1 hypothetical protein PBT88_20700 [Sphingomonas abietis]
MGASLAHAAPVRFLIGITLVWTMARGMALVGWSTTVPKMPSRHDAIARHRSLSFLVRTPPPPVLTVGRRAGLVVEPGSAARDPTMRDAVLANPSTGLEDDLDPHLLRLTAATSGVDRPYRPDSGLPDAAAIVGANGSSHRWSGSAWSFLRGGGRASTSSLGGQIGGGQAGARILYHLDRAGRIAVAGRISAAIGGARQTEAAVGLDWKPIALLPVHLMAERRVAIDHGGRNAWTLGAAGGVYDVRIAPGWRLDAYAEAGVVGARRQDLYADGAARIARSIALGGNMSLAIGGGAWGAAQPGATRIDIGPSATLRLPVAHHAVAVALDWRERVAGRARPGSGLALTVATDF